MTQKCRKCLKIKDRSEFYPDKQNKDGLQYYCKDCSKKRVKESKLKHHTKDEMSFKEVFGDWPTPRELKQYLDTRSSYE